MASISAVPYFFNKIKRIPIYKILLGAVIVLAVLLNFYRLDQNGFPNVYYAAAVRSMLSSWHNFFFVSFDPSGYVSVNKPPLGLWIQTAFAFVFGFKGISLLFPQAISGVLSVIVIYHLVKRNISPWAGVIAAFVLTITPICVAINRNNSMDSQLVLVLLLAAWSVISATKNGNLTRLLFCAVLVGAGFNIKMLQAYMVLPAFAILYLIAAPIKIWKRFVHLMCAGTLLVIISFSWVVFVDLTPSANRPFVGSSTSNTVMELIYDYNGLKRLIPGNLPLSLGFGNDNLPYPFPDKIAVSPGQGGQTLGLSGFMAEKGTIPVVSGPSFSNTAGISRFMAAEIGDRGWFRLFNKQLAGQASWLLPLVFFSTIVIGWQTRLRRIMDKRHQFLLLWGMWLVPQAIFFNFASMFHRHYLVMIAPAIAALAGGGIYTMWNDYKNPGLKGWLLPVVIVICCIVEIIFLLDFPDYSSQIMPVMISLTIFSVGRLIYCRFIGTEKKALVGLIAGLTAILISPAVWSVTPLIYKNSFARLPFAGPNLSSMSGGEIIGNADNDKFIEFLRENRGDEKYFLITSDARSASPVILATGEKVMARGGYGGDDNIISDEALGKIFINAEARFYLSQRSSPGFFEKCEMVPDELWRSVPSGSGPPFPPGDFPGQSFMARQDVFGVSGSENSFSGFIKAFDKNNDNMVETNEFSGPSMIFAHFDKNNDDLIDEEEAPKGPLAGRSGGGPEFGQGDMVLYDCKIIRSYNIAYNK